jgi:sensor histidine kinase regulating citrate/malate metabolism
MDENKLLEMFKLREDILMALEEGILAIDKNKKVIFINKSAIPMLHITESEPIGKDFMDCMVNVTNKWNNTRDFSIFCSRFCDKI